MLQIVAQAAADPRVDVEKMRALLDMRNEEISRLAKIAFTEAMNRVKPKLPRIAKTGAIVLKDNKARIKYAKYEDIHAAVMPLLHDEGFTVAYTSDLAGTQQTTLRVTVIVKHKQGHEESGSVFLPLIDDTGAKNRVQGAGSILSYGKRYALCQYLDIVAEDEDDNGMGGSTEPITEQQKNNILDMILDREADEGRFLAYISEVSHTETKRIEDIQQRHYETAMSALRQKRKRQ